jgi:2-C-methyl-D-erythritol 4-phosphate cytidylyltransferase
LKKLTSAIIAAGGRGARFQSERPKQFLELLGKPIIIYTLERFERCQAVDEIVLVLPTEEINAFVPIAESAKITKLKRIVVGGATRAESVKNGLDAVDPSAEIVAVHDGARPLVTSSEIAAVVERAAETGAACLAAPVTDTVKTVKNGSITGTVDRSRLRRALTPQAFRYDILQRAFDGAELGEDVTDECYLVEKLGVEIATVEGDSRNIKITRPEDIVVAEAYLVQLNLDR